jgi:hypothetical protein
MSKKKKPLEAKVVLRLRMTPGLRAAAEDWGMSEEEYFAAYVRFVRTGSMKPVEGSLIREDK